MKRLDKHIYRILRSEDTENQKAIALREIAVQLVRDLQMEFRQTEFPDGEFNYMHDDFMTEYINSI